MRSSNSILDVVSVLNEQEDYQKNRNYWKYLNAKLRKESPELVSGTTQLKLTAADEKKYNSDVLDFDGIVALAKVFPNAKANKFLEWFTYSDETIDGKSKQKAYSLLTVRPLTALRLLLAEESANVKIPYGLVAFL